MLDPLVSTIINAEGWGISRHGKDSTFCLICLIMSVCISDQGIGLFPSLLHKGSSNCKRLTFCKLKNFVKAKLRVA